MCVTDRHDMTLAVKLALNPNTTNNTTNLYMKGVPACQPGASELEVRGSSCNIISKYTMINPFPNKPWFLRVCNTSLLKTLWEKEKLLVTSNFSFSHSVFHPFRELPTIFIKIEIVVCKLFQFGRV